MGLGGIAVMRRTATRLCTQPVQNSSRALFCSLSSSLIQAVHAGEVREMQRLLDDGAPANAVDANGDSALLHASGLGSARLVQELIAQGTDIHAALDQGSRMQEGCPAYLLGCYSDIAAALIARGARVSHVGQYQATPLMWAAYVGFPPIVHQLLEAGADANQADQWGDTALINTLKWSYEEAPFGAYAEVGRLLLEHRADKTQKNQTGESALSIFKSLKRRNLNDGLDALFGAKATS